MVDVSLTKSPLFYARISVFFLTYVCFVVLHAARRSLSAVKTTISEVWSPLNASNEYYPPEIWTAHRLFDSPQESSMFLGGLDASFMFTYAIAMFVSGKMGDVYNKKIILFAGMILTGATLLLFGYVSEALHIYNVAWYMTFWILNAIGQSTAWPILIAVMGNWFSKASSGVVMGFWSSCASVGNILGSEIAALVLPSGYENVFLVNSTWVTIVGVFIVIFLKCHPGEIGLSQADVEADPEQDRQELVGGLPSDNGISFIDALRLPGVVQCSVCFACIKMVLYSFFFWLPFYLHNKYGWKEYVDDQLSVWFDVGAIAGGVSLGWISDKIGFRIIVIEISLLVGIPVLVVYNGLPSILWVNGIVMSALGFFIGGCNNIIGTALTQDLSKNPMARGRAMSTVAGIIDGTGSFGAAAGQLALPALKSRFGWGGVFSMFIAAIVVALLVLLPSFVSEAKAVAVRLRGREQESE